MKRGSEKATSPNWITHIRLVNPLFVILGMVMMMVFSLYATIYQFVFSDNKVDLFAHAISDLALYFSPFDQELADQLLQIDRMSQSYLSGDNILLTHRSQLDGLVDYVRQHQDYLIHLGFVRYRHLFRLMSDALAYKDELYTLLGAYEPKHYLVILQNVAEKRPNGGFFGSFAFVTIDQARVVDVDIIDTYFPNAIAPDAYIPAPEWARHMMAPKIGFLSSNRFGFTAMDGATIVSLYEKIFGGGYSLTNRQRFFSSERYKKLFYQKIAGVVFIRSDVMTTLLPGFEQKLREWQFVNASIDLIRGVNISNKKELYIKEVNEYFDRYKGQIFMNVVNQFPTIQSRHYIQVYLPRVSSGLQQFLITHGFQTVPQKDTLYARDNNDSFNKSDSFVSKRVSIRTTGGIVLRETDQDIVTLPGDVLERIRGTQVELLISYDLHVPDRYVGFIEQLAERYGIQMTARERSILVLEPVTWMNPQDPIMRRTQGHLYYPKNRTLTPKEKNLTGFEAPFAKGRAYTATLRQNNTSTSQQFMLEVE